MKTLKKVLSVALVIAMAFSLVTMVGAAGTVAKYQDFTDADAIVNKEAVDTLVGLGVINGMDDGSYAPNGHFTRAQASKIIAYLLLGDNVAASLRASSAPFADVAATHWAAPYIQYCASRGILNGVGDNKFDPEGSVTAAQFAKMLLTAAGYGKQGEFVGDDWLLNTIILAQNVGILDTDADYNAPATRDEVARYAFNFYTKVAYVSFSKDTEEYTEKTVKVGGEDVPYTLAQQQGVGYVGATKYVNGVASQQWGKNGKALTGNYFPAGNVKVLYSGIYIPGVNTPKMVSDKLYLGYETTVRIIVNGSSSSTHTGEGYVNAALTAAATAAAGAGSEFAFVDEDGDNLVDVISVVKKYAVKLTSDVTVTPNGKVTILGLYPSAASDIRIKGIDKAAVVGYEGLKRDDVMLYYYDAALETYFVEKATVVTGVVSKAKVAGSTITALTVNGTDYVPYGSALAPVSYLDKVALSKSNVLYLDSHNFVVYAEVATSAPVATNYGLVLNYAEGKNAFEVRTGTDTVRILKEDGTVAIYNTTYVEDAVFANEDLPALVSYTLDDAGLITLNVLTVVEGKVETTYSKGDNVVKYTDGAAEDPAKETYYLSSGTKVFYYASGSYKVVTGYANTMEVAANKPLVVYSVNASSKVADVIFFGSAPTTPAPTVKYAFTPAKLDWSTKVVIGTTEYREAVAYVNGEEITLTAKKSLIESVNVAGAEGITIKDKDKDGAFVYAVDKDGYVTSLDFTDSTYNRLINTNNDGKVSFVTDGYLLYGSSKTPLFTTENTKYYRYDAASKAVVDDILAASSEVLEYHILGVILDANGKAAEVYFKYEFPTE